MEGRQGGYSSRMRERAPSDSAPHRMSEHSSGREMRGGSGRDSYGDPRDNRHSREHREYRSRDRRRPRSISPERYMPRQEGKRSRRDEANESGYRGSPEYHSRDRRSYDDYREYDRVPPPKEPEAPKQPYTFKEFVLKEVDDNVEPAVAQQMYDDYLTDYYRGEVRAKFEKEKENDEFRSLFDPRIAEKTFAKHGEEAKAAAVAFDIALKDGKMDPKSKKFRQGAFELVPDIDLLSPEALANRRFAPVITWRPERIRRDLELSSRLIEKLDEEKGIEYNPLIAKAEDTKEAEKADGAEEQVEQPTGVSEGSAPSAEATGAEAGAEVDVVKPASTDEVAAGESAEAKEAAVAKSGDEEKTNAEAEVAKKDDKVAEETASAVAVPELPLSDAIDKLDLQLTWLWKVHGVDYYAGIELWGVDWNFRNTDCRLIRGPKPDEAALRGEPSSADVEAVRHLDSTWEQRVAEGDPLLLKCMRTQVEAQLEHWIDSQVVHLPQPGKDAWGSKLSAKLFMSVRYVIKHIRNKHEDALLKEKDRIYEELFFENFKKDWEEKRAAEEQMILAQQARHDEQMMEWSGLGGEEAALGGPFGGGPFGGRGGRMMHGPVLDPQVFVTPVPPIIVPGPGGPILHMVAPGGMMLGRGGRGGRGMPGGRGGGDRWNRTYEGAYLDLDNPANNRLVLDYGDL